jgi:hypothetical protein
VQARSRQNFIALRCPVLEQVLRQNCDLRITASAHPRFYF